MRIIVPLFWMHSIISNYSAILAQPAYRFQELEEYMVELINRYTKFVLIALINIRASKQYKLGRYLRKTMITEQEFTGTQVMHRIQYKDQESVLQLVQSIFDDVTIYNNPKIASLITESPKGYIPVHQLLQLPQFTTHTTKNPNTHITPSQLTRIIATQSKKLLVKNNKIRRVQSFIDKIQNKTLKPIYIDRLPALPTLQIYQFFKNIVGVVYQIYHKKSERWAIILVQDYSVLEQVKNQLYIGEHKIYVLGPLETLACYGENQRLSSDFHIIKLYQNKNMITEPDLQDHTQFQQQQHDANAKNTKKKKSQKMKYMRNFEDDEIRRKAKSMKIYKNMKKQINQIMNFDNTPLLQLRNNHHLMEMTQ